MERNSPARVAAADPGEVSLLLSFDADQQVYRYRLVDSSGYYSEEVRLGPAAAATRRGD